jgi:hypothetical protein
MRREMKEVKNEMTHMQQKRNEKTTTNLLRSWQKKRELDFPEAMYQMKGGNLTIERSSTRQTIDFRRTHTSSID